MEHKLSGTGVVQVITNGTYRGEEVLDCKEVPLTDRAENSLEKLRQDGWKLVMVTWKRDESNNYGHEPAVHHVLTAVVVKTQSSQQPGLSRKQLQLILDEAQQRLNTMSTEIEKLREELRKQLSVSVNPYSVLYKTVVSKIQQSRFASKLHADWQRNILFYRLAIKLSAAWEWLRRFVHRRV